MSRRVVRWGTPFLVASLVASVGGGYGEAPPVVAAEPETTGASVMSAPSVFSPVEPCRLVDTRDREAPDRLSARSSTAIAVAGRCDVPAAAVAASLTITAVDPAGPGFLTAYADGADRPDTSVVNYREGDVIANQQIVPLGEDGSIRVFSLSRSDLVVDVTGFFEPATDERSRAGRFVPVSQRRLIDTRASERPAAATSVHIDPELGTDAIAVVVNITTTETRRPGFFTAHPSGGDLPEASTLNVDRAGQTRAINTIVGVGADGFDVHTSAGDHVIVDLLGYFTGPSAERSADGLYVAMSPVRLVDTRLASAADGGPRLWDRGTREFATAQLVGDAAAIAANVTVTDTEDLGFVVAYPAGARVPPTSTVNYDRAQHTMANSAIVQLSERGVAVRALEATHVTVDVGGWFTGTPVEADRPVPANDPPADRFVTIISDSAMAGVRWNGALDGFQGFHADAKLESCRRLVGYSCRGREGYAPRTALSEIQALPPADPEDMLVIATGYNDWHVGFAEAFDAVVGAARAQGFRHIVWVDYRSDVGYRLPGSGGVRSNYGEMNRVLGEKLASGEFPDVRRWRFDDYTRGAVGWFTYDGVHERTLGSWGVTDWISRHVRAFDDRPCVRPWTVGGHIDDPCPDPDSVVGERGVPDIASLYAAEIAG